MVELTPEAIDAAMKAFLSGAYEFEPQAMRAALDAAVKAQWGSVPSVGYLSGFDAGRIQGRVEAFEEAAAVADRIAPDLPEVADAIRTLAKDPPK